MRTLLVTGFGAFPGAPRNPSADVARLLQRSTPEFARADVRLRVAVLPVVHDIAPALETLTAREKPDAILHLGLAARRRRVSVETRALNRASTLRPDARGRFCARLALRPGDAFARRATWPAGAFVVALRGQGIKAALSVDAGDYVCNAALWASLGARAIPTLFVHMPRARVLAPARMAVALTRILPAFAARLNRIR